MLYLPQNTDPSVSFNLQRSSSSSFWSTRISHRLNVIIKHHTSIHIIIHETNNRSKLEQYTKHKIKMKSLWNESTSRYETQRREKHANRSYGWKDTTTERFALYVENKTIGFIYFNYIEAYINWIKSNLELNYKTKVKQIIFYL